MRTYGPILYRGVQGCDKILPRKSSGDRCPEHMIPGLYQGSPYSVNLDRGSSENQMPYRKGGIDVDEIFAELGGEIFCN